MAAALIGEALISASIEVLCDRVTSAEFIDLFRQKKLDEPLLMNLKTTLLILFAVLNDAEEKQIVNPAVREWLNSSSILSWMQRTYLMRLTLKLCDASWKEQTKYVHTWHRSSHHHFRQKISLQVSAESMNLSRYIKCNGNS